MPILAEEPSMFPENLLGPEGLAATSPQVERCWWALYTKARQEKAVARQLHKFRVPFYLPLIPKTSVYRGRKITSQIPLFTAYMFLFGTEEDRVKALTTNRLSNILRVPDQLQISHDLAQVQQLIAARAPLTVESRLMPGRRVRVRSGVFAGLEGVVLSRVKQTRLIIAVHFLQQGVSVEIDDFMLEPLD